VQKIPANAQAATAPNVIAAKIAIAVTKMPKSSSAGKGDSPRNNFSKKFQENYSKINWKNQKARKKIKKKNAE